MEKRTLISTNLEVSKFALGTADYGTKYTKEEAFSQLDAFVSGGGNLIDTACVYGSWIPGLGNISEKIIGEWMHQRANRNQVIISTKGAHPLIETMSESRVYPSEITKDLEGSLQALQTDVIDLYFLHRDNPQVPLEELLGCLEEHVKKGNIRYYGCSNWRLNRILEAQTVAKKEGFKGFVCNQLMFSLATCDEAKLWDDSLVMMDKATYENHLEQNWNVMAYMAVARGYLVKRIRGVAAKEAGAVAYQTNANEEIIAYLKELEKCGYAPDEISLAYLMNQKLPTIPVVSFSCEEQLQCAFRSTELVLPAEIMERLDEIRMERNRC